MEQTVRRIILGVPLRRNPTTVTTNSVTPQYNGFQPLDGTIVPIQLFERMEITLAWDRVSGADLMQLINIIGKTQVDGTRAPVVLNYNDRRILEGPVIVVNASVEPLQGTGGPLVKIDGWGAQVPLVAAVTITLVPVDYKILRRA